MSGFEIITLISNNLPTVINTAVGAVTGGIFTAIFLRYNTSTAEFEKIKAGQFKEVANELLTSGKMSYTEYYKANNFLKIAKKADKYYSEILPKDHFESYDFDWFIRFYEAAGNISNKEMQELWAKILAGEINHPSTYSLRTIDVLKNLSKKDAELFEKICLHSIYYEGKYFLPNYDEYLEHCKIQYSDIMQLSELGLIYNDALIVLKIQTDQEEDIIFLNNDLLINYQLVEDTKKTFNIKQFPFTNVGYEIASLKNISASNEDFIFFAKVLNKSNGINIGVHKIINVCNNQIKFQLDNLLEEKIKEE